MADRKKFIVANWKMNLTMQEASLFVHKLSGLIQVHRDVEVVLAPTMLTIQSLSLQIDRRQFKLAAQNLYWQDSGAYTGEISAAQLRGIVDYSLVGHSERRHVFGETDKDVRAKVQAAVRNRIKPILCVGETAIERKANETADVLQDQVTGGLANLTADDMERVVIAYEPVWAISDGKNFASHAAATPHDAEVAATVIRRQIAHMFGKKVADATPVLYGASAHKENAASLLAAKGIDGLLIGGASLDAEEFSEIVAIAHEE